MLLPSMGQDLGFGECRTRAGAVRQIEPDGDVRVLVHENCERWMIEHKSGCVGCNIRTAAAFRLSC